MKKHIIAAAVATAVSVPAMAQQVEIYGRLDTGYTNSNTKLYGTYVDNDVTGAVGASAGYIKRAASSWGLYGNQGDSNVGTTAGADGRGGLTSSRLGFRGTEDLGGGMKAGFNYELGLTPNSSSAFATTQVRAAFVNLSGSFGDVRAGRFYSSFFDDFTGLDAGAANNFTGAGTYTYNSTIKGGVRYTSPTFSGVTVTGEYGDDKTKDTDDAGTQSDKKQTKSQTIKIRYAAGPLVASLTSGSNRTRADMSATSTLGMFGAAAADVAEGTAPELITKQSENMLSLSYDLAGPKVYYNYHNVKRNYTGETAAGVAGNITAATGASTDGVTTTDEAASEVDQSGNIHRIGVSIPFGATTVFALYTSGSAKNEFIGGTTDVTVRSSRQGAQVGVIHSLSKRTMAYAIAGQLRDKVKESETDTTNTWGFGLRHDF